jgi:hypothetical protein
LPKEFVGLKSDKLLAAQPSGTCNLKQAERPPSAGITAPVTVRDSFDARNTAMAAISSDC